MKECLLSFNTPPSPPQKKQSELLQKKIRILKAFLVCYSVEWVSDVSKSPRSFANLGTTRPMTHRRRHERQLCENLAFPTNLEDANV